MGDSDFLVDEVVDFYRFMRENAKLEAAGKAPVGAKRILLGITKASLSDRAKEDIDRLGSARHRELTWSIHEGCDMKGFPGTFTLWSLEETGTAAAGNPTRR